MQTSDRLHVAKVTCSQLSTQVSRGRSRAGVPIVIWLKVCIGVVGSLDILADIVLRIGASGRLGPYG